MNGQPQQLELNRQAIGQSINTGLKMLTSEDISTPNAWNKDLATLEQFLINILTGRLVYNEASTERPPEGKSSRPPIDPPGDQSSNSVGEGDDNK